MATWHELPVSIEDGLLLVGSNPAVHRNEWPVLRRFAEIVAGGDVLEMGFGLGMSATEIQKIGCKSHTIIEAHPVIAANAREWAKAQPSPVAIVEGYWQDVLPSVGLFDGVLYDSYESSDTDRLELFASQIGPHMRPGGVFTGWCDMNPPSERLMTALLSFSDDVRFEVFGGVKPCRTWPDNHRMVIPIARKR